MSSNLNNHTRLLGEMLSVEAWHSPFQNGRAEADLYLAVSFRSGFFGAGPSDLVRFKLSIKRAEVIVIEPLEGGLRVPPGNVWRPKSTLKASESETRHTETGGKISAQAEAKGGSSGVAFDATLSGGASASSASSSQRDFSTSYEGYKVQHFQTERKEHAWDIQHPAGKPLIDTVISSDTPVMKIIDTRTNRDTGIEPSVAIQVRCRRQDFIIEDFEIKDSQNMRKFKSSSGKDEKTAAIHAVILRELDRASLPDAKLDEKLAFVILADTKAIYG